MQAAIHYRVASAVPASHRFQVTLTIAQPDPQGQRLWLPDWIPGSYMIRDFARNITKLNAHDASGRTVAVQALDKSSWQCAPSQGALTVDYEVYAWDLSVRAAHLDQHHGYFNGTSLFLAVSGQENQPVQVALCCPDGVSDWQVATTLPSISAAPLGFGLYGAENYDALIDHPVEMGRFTYAEFEASGVPHAVAITGQFHADVSRLVRDLKVICEAQIAFFGAPAPFSRYLFQIMVVGQGYGGLEHRSSTSLLCSRDDLPAWGESESKPGDRYRGLLGLCSHEYFHSWNVKQLKPKAFMPYDLRREVRTDLLWFFEGVTSYYDELFLVRTGLISPTSYLELLGQHITRHLRTLGREHQTVAQSSFDAWTKYYKSDENTPNSVVSYYIKGALVALCLDLYLRAETQHKDSLDTVMRCLWQRFALTQTGITELDIRTVLVERVGPSIHGLLDLALHSTDELPWQELLKTVGLTATLRASEGASDLGGKPATGSGERQWLGVKTQAAEGGVQLTYVQSGSPAEKAGLSAGDVVIALDGLRINHANWEKRLQQRAVGDRVSVYAFRRDEWLATSCELAAAPLDTCFIPWPNERADQHAAEHWLLTPSVASPVR